MLILFSFFFLSHLLNNTVVVIYHWLLSPTVRGYNARQTTVLLKRIHTGKDTLVTGQLLSSERGSAGKSELWAGVLYETVGRVWREGMRGRRKGVRYNNKISNYLARANYRLDVRALGFPIT